MTVFVQMILAGVFSTMLFPCQLFASPANDAQARLGNSNTRRVIAVAKFGGDSGAAEVLTSIVADDLDRTARFQVLRPVDESLDESQRIDYANWKTTGKDFLVVGSVRLGNDGSIETRFRLHDVQAGKEMGGQSLVIGRQHLHRVAHRISDFIYEKLTGKQGPLSSRLAYVTKSTDRYLLMIADADGGYPQTAMVSKEPITSLAWAPEGRRIALVSHEAINPATGLSHPMVFMLSLASGQRQLLFNPLLGETVAGITWSPDGTSVAVMSRKGDRSALVVINVDGKEEKPISISRSEDANPAFSADSQYIYFDSNRSGSQQIYRIPVRSGSPEQVFKGANESLAPCPSRDGKTLAYIARSGFQERLAVLDLASGTSTVLQESPASQRLSFAANGDFFLFSEKSNGTSILKAVSMETLGSISWTTASEAANSTDFVLSPAENKEP